MRIAATALCVYLAGWSSVEALSAQAPRAAHPLQDSAHLLGSQWVMTPLVRADSLATDSLALRSIERAFWLAPNRLVYSGRLAQSNRRALIGWVNGSTTLLAVDGREFSVTPGRAITVRFGQGWRMVSDFAAADGAFYVSTATGRGFSVYSTDGASWAAVAHRGDSVTLRGRRRSVAYAKVVGTDAGRAVLGLDGDGFEGLVRVGPGGLEVLVARGDTLPGGFVVLGGWSRMMLRASEYRSASPGDWSLLLRNRVSSVVGPRDGVVRELARSSESLPDEASRDWQDIWRAVPLADGRLVLDVGRGAGKFITGRPGAWRTLATGREWLRERSNIVRLDDATAVDSSLLLFAVTQADREYMNGRMEGQFADLYAFDGVAVRPVPWDSVFGTTIREYRRSGPGGGFELSGGFTFRQIPGYTARLAVVTPFRQPRTPGGRYEPVELLFDPALRRLVRMPSLQTVDGDSVSLSDILGWNSADEAVALSGNSIVALRRR